MKTTNRRLVKFGLLAVALALTLLAPLPEVVAQAQPVTPPVAPGSVSLDVTCTPDTFPPDELVVIECVTHIKNNGENAIPAGSVNVGSEGGAIPDYYWVSYFHSGQYWPISEMQLDFPVPTLQPGETFESKVTELSRMSEGTWRGNASLVVNDESLATVSLQQTASSDAPALPRDLDVTTTLVNAVPGEELAPLPSAIYETKIVNKGSSAVTELTISERYDYARLVKVAPEPSVSFRKDDYNLLSWNLTSFGVDSLAPGESLLLRTEYGPISASECGSIGRGVVVEAKVDGSRELYGARPASGGVQLGDCNLYEGVPDGRGGDDTTAKTFGSPGTIAFGRGGDGPAEATFDVVWTAAFLAVAGAGLVAAALLARKRLLR